MKKKTEMNYAIIKIFFWSLFTMVLLTYGMGWIDLATNDKLSGRWWKDFFKSLSYYIDWVLPYWWLIIILGTIVLFLVGIGIRWGIEKYRTH